MEVVIPITMILVEETAGFVMGLKALVKHDSLQKVTVSLTMNWEMCGRHHNETKTFPALSRKVGKVELEARFIG